MPKNKGKGGKNRKRGTNKNDPEKRDLILKGEGQEYGQAIKMLGNSRLQVYCFDGVQRLGVICGTLRRRVWINPGDTVLVSLREFQDTRCDVVFKYLSEEVKRLQKMNEIPDQTRANEGESHLSCDTNIVFEAMSDSEIPDDSEEGFVIVPEEGEEEEEEEDDELVSEPYHDYTTNTTAPIDIDAI
eukprot:TRINITY_DN508_c0_g2_i1.p1 TRINITY_DN508_c0_g2~~TRINITY_DN508_c0_g2_i1.p1  ORF type:complete len:186 (+),score=44.57 TRINITY_DN508_c0_g2_i1:158-715(+)